MCALCDFDAAPQGRICGGGGIPAAALPSANAAWPEAFLPGDVPPAPLAAEAAAAPGIEITALLRSPNPGWNGAIGRGGVVTFSFAQTPEAGTTPGAFGRLTAAQAASARLALDAWADMSGIRFVEVPDRAGGGGIDIRFQKESMAPETAGFAHYPPNGAISLSSTYYETDPMEPGSYGFLVLLHEVGHALGLKHPFDGSIVLPATQDNWQNTVMSYTHTGPTPAGIQPLDAAAIAYVYGTEAGQPGWATGARYDAASDSVVMTGDGGADTIWGTGRRSIAHAGGGNDTLLGGRGDEQLFGEDGDDRIHGREGANLLDGGAGNDILTAGSRRDTLLGGTGDDVLYGGGGDDWLAGGAGLNAVAGGSGIDTIAMEAGRLSSAITRVAEFNLRVNGNPITAFSGTIADAGETTVFHEVENFAFLDGRLVFASSDPVMQVYRLYQGALGRAPDPIGLNGWAADLQAGTGLSAVASAFVGSAEFGLRFGAPDSSGFLDLAYQNVLGRAADPDGAAHWTSLLSGGASRADLIIGLTESAEAKARTAATLPNGLWDQDESAATIARVYQAALGRRPEEAGLRGWKASLDAGLSLEDMALGFTASAEFAARYGTPDNAAFVSRLYANVLGRAPDEAGLAAWRDALDAGDTGRAEVLLGFSESPEFRLASQAWIEGGIVFA